jgi:hypothetical protein
VYAYAVPPPVLDASQAAQEPDCEIGWKIMFPHDRTNVHLYVSLPKSTRLLTLAQFM